MNLIDDYSLTQNVFMPTKTKNDVTLQTSMIYMRLPALIGKTAIG